MKEYHLQCKVRVRESEGLVWEWRNVESSDDELDLYALIPKGNESDYRILNRATYKKQLCQFKNKKYGDKKKAFRNKLLKLMKEKRILRTELYKMCGIPRATFWTYCNAVSLPSEENLQKICEVLGVSKAELLGGGDNE